MASVLPISIGARGATPARWNQPSMIRRSVAPASKRISEWPASVGASTARVRRHFASGGAMATSSSRKNGVTLSSRSRTGRLTIPTSSSLATTARVISAALPVTITTSVSG